MLFHRISNFFIAAIFWVQFSHALPVLNVTLTQLRSSNSSETLTQGWTPSPSGRGTIDIIWSCLVTIFLCSWSVLCLQVPSEQDSRFDILWRRSWLTALCALGPEFTFQLALGQWSSARQSVKDFNRSKFPEWTMKHAFYADSGGFFLKTPDFKPIPVDAKQLLYLIDHEYVGYPTLSEHDIDAKNKVDVLLRAISIGQTTWFIIIMAARSAQGLFITGMELTTAAFILCSFGTSYCWWNKGADVAVPIILSTETTMVDILKDAGDAAAAPYHRTPLDFISREEWHWSLYWTHWINILRHMHIVFAPKALPHDRLENTIWHPVKIRGSLEAFILMSLAYSAIFVTGWNKYFPTTSERTLWRISSLSMMTTIALYCLITGFAYVFWPAFKRCFQKKATLNPDSAAPVTQLPRWSRYSSKPRSKLTSIAASLRNNSILQDPSLDVPLKATLPIYAVGFLYCSSRTLILVLDIIQLRSLPTSAFDTLNWVAFFPHLS
jgi:hypothetical protein